MMRGSESIVELDRKVSVEWKAIILVTRPGSKKVTIRRYFQSRESGTWEDMRRKGLSERQAVEMVRIHSLLVSTLTGRGWSVGFET